MRLLCFCFARHWFDYYNKFFFFLFAAAMCLAIVTTSAGIDIPKGKSHLVTNPEWQRRRTKNSECRLGGVRYALNSTWSPNLGPPFGVWNCVRCTCSPLKKKRRIVAKVICRNLKNECPTKLECEAPVILPGACCKACPKSEDQKDFVQEERISAEARAEKDFAVLLNGRTSLIPTASKNIATGRIYLRRGSLHFSFLVDGGAPRKSKKTSTPNLGVSSVQSDGTETYPNTIVQFMDGEGNVLEEIEAQPTPYEVNNGRICGTWTRVPRQYRTLLMREEMWVSVGIGSSEDSISGHIRRYKGVDTEIFSALLVPVPLELENKGEKRKNSAKIFAIETTEHSDPTDKSLEYLITAVDASKLSKTKEKLIFPTSAEKSSKISEFSTTKNLAKSTVQTVGNKPAIVPLLSFPDSLTFIPTQNSPLKNIYMSDSRDLIANSKSINSKYKTNSKQNLRLKSSRTPSLSSGGTAIISVSAPSNSLHISLVFNGIFKSYEERNVTVYLELRPLRNIKFVRDTIVLKKVFSDINEADILTTLGESSLRLLTRGKVILRIWSPNAPEWALEGLISSRATCNAFHSILTTTPQVSKENAAVLFGSGWGLLFLSNEGDFQYQIRLENLEKNNIKKVALISSSRKNKIRQIEDVTDDYSEGWINGTFEKPTYRELDALLRQRVKISVELMNGKILDGRLELVSVTEALRTLHPILLTAANSWIAATAWVAVDEDCVMHYDIRVAGADPAGGTDPTWSLKLRESDKIWDPRHEQANLTLEHVVNGREVAAHTTLLTKVALSRINYEAAFLDLAVSNSKTSFVPSVILSGRLRKVKVPKFCLFDAPANVQKSPEISMQVDAPCRSFHCLNDETKPIVKSTKCIDHEKRVFHDGTTWKSPLSKCARCMCTLGTIKCENEPCPEPTCVNSTIPAGECCPTCPATESLFTKLNEKMTCKMDDDLHVVGSVWHPFLAPNGFDRCVTCYCNITWKGRPIVQCHRVSCPKLNCRETEANYVNGSCCPKCPSTTPSPLYVKKLVKLKDMFNEGMVEVKSGHMERNKVLADGGCLERNKFLHSNGDVWYPILSPNGVQLCVACTCKDGKISCVGTSCPSGRCSKGRSCKRKKDKYYKKKKKSKYNRVKRLKLKKRKNRRKKF